MKPSMASNASIALSSSDVSDAYQFFPSPLRSSGNLDYQANRVMQFCGSGLRWTPEMRQVAMRESCSYKRNRSSHEAVTAEAQRDVQGEVGGAQGRVGELAGEFSPSQIHAWKKALLDGACSRTAAIGTTRPAKSRSANSTARSAS
jgi:hypothetical protein